MLVLVYVDEILIIGGNYTLNSQFALNDLGAVNYFPGFEAQKTDTAYYLTQRKYAINLLAKTNLLRANPYPSPMCQSKKFSAEWGELLQNTQLYQSTSGAFKYLTLIRHDIAYPVNTLSQCLK